MSSKLKKNMVKSCSVVPSKFKILALMGNCMMKIKQVFSLLLIISLSGCGGGKADKKQKPRTSKNELATKVDIPTADEGIRSFFDEDIGEFTLVDDELEKKNSPGSLNYSIDSIENPDKDDFSWASEDDDEKKENFKVVYFDFNRDTVRQDQEAIVEQNITLAKNMLKEGEQFGTKPTVIIEGHACHSAGSAIYNLALSEKRAKVLADRFCAAGIPRECIKIVGRGKEVPAIINGKTVSGDRNQQWPNRRDEIRLIYS